MGHWALILGHSPKNVSLALSKQVKKGTLYGTVNTISIELAETIQKLMPKAERLRFATTGSEATMYAVRLARAATRKKIVAKIIGGWHGFNSSLLKSVNYPFEIKEGLGLDVDNKYIRSIPFNDLDTSLDILNKIKEDLACIIVEPILGGAGCITPNNDYLQGLQEFSKKNNIIFILDEIVTGFRLSIHGAYKMFKLDPDLITLGKIAGGGLPIGIVCGKTEILSISNPNDKNN
jgi:glutamate-1-semialdehyde 2,1-aminomutase